MRRTKKSFSTTGCVTPSEDVKSELWNPPLTITLYYVTYICLGTRSYLNFYTVQPGCTCSARDYRPSWAQFGRLGRAAGAQGHAELTKHRVVPSRPSRSSARRTLFNDRQVHRCRRNTWDRNSGGRTSLNGPTYPSSSSSFSISFSSSSSSSSEFAEQVGRTMVKKFRWQALRRKIWSPSLPPSTRLFSESQWQENVNVWYFLYRWLNFGCWSAIIVCSIFDLGSRYPGEEKRTWLIYLTHWDLVLGAAQAFLGAVLVTRRRNLERRLNFDPDYLVFGRVERAYWILYTITSSLAICVTVGYWGAVYDPKVHNKDPLNFMLHLLNSILILFDLLIVAFPLRIEHFWWPVSCVTIYLLFTVFYYLAGGLDKNGLHYIYKVLDWEKPGRSTLISFGGLLFLTIVHCVLCSIAKLRIYVRAKAAGAIKTTTIADPQGSKMSPRISTGFELSLPTIKKSDELIDV
ncbi:uncharacterized protein LOC105687580 isoform X1 [Athalia rosae]|uniref:uncharacterized protein LOC105687580 isoform X1 n=1 Tax=Athalia rosae TaxID=37344 RepID=UPI0020346E04|nr:uncharacterized protein LOC105687580 isoform X1 [Athalia rosae]XP_048509682.1 uncharacterized protein LOC105687580 isoform X1 [Athalia rosae]